MRHLAKRFLALTLATSVAACTTVGPDYERPEIETGSGWIDREVGEASFVDIETWWTSLHDEELSRLIDEALTAAPEVRIAEARRMRAAALVRRAGADFRPNAGVSAGATAERQSLNANPAIGAFEGLERDQATFAIGATASWELDLFGGGRRAREAAFYRYQAADELVRDANVSVALELARLYFGMRASQQIKAQREAIVVLRSEALSLMQLRFDEGYSSRVELETAREVLADAEAELAAISNDPQAAAMAIATLLGKPPEAELALLEDEPDLPDIAPPPRYPRADLVRRRPDVRAAERELAANVAGIGVATAELFPQVFLTGGAGFRSLDLGNLVNEPSNFLSLGGLFSWRLFDGGRIRAEIDVAEADSEIALLAFEAAVVTALGEAERSLAQLMATMAEDDARSRSYLAAQDRSILARERFAAGDISRLTAIDAASSMADAAIEVSRVRRQRLESAIGLYGALGGGWTAEPASSVADSPGGDLIN